MNTGRADLRVALVYVGAPEDAQYPVMSPPVGIQLLGAVLLRAGYHVELFDTRLQPSQELRELLGTYDPRVVGLSFLSPSSGQAIRLGKAMRGAGRFVVAGGVHATMHPEQLLCTGAADTVVQREGETAILDICASLADGGRPPKIVIGEPVRDLDALPDYPALGCYRGVYERRTGYLPVYLQLGRGCPMHCTFCELPNRRLFEPLGRRFRSADRILAELHTYVDRWGVNFVTLVDSIATLNIPLITEVIRRMDDELPGVGLMFNGHVNRFTPGLARQIQSAHRHRSSDQRITTWFGFESGSQRLLDLMRKQTTVTRALQIAELCREHGVQVGANLLLGVPTETAKDYAMHHAFMDAVEPTFPNPNILNPLPGTEMYDYCLDRGLLRDPDDYSIWSWREIQERGHGPLHGVDYDLVLSAYHRYRNPPSSPERSFIPWGEQR